MSLRPSNKLVDVYKEKGPHDKEFVEELQKFFWFVIGKYTQSREEDIHQQSLLHFYEALEWYDPKKQRIDTFAYSIARNRCSSFLHHKKKFQKHDPEEALELKPSPDIPSSDKYDMMKKIDRALVFDRIEVEVSINELLVAVVDDVDVAIVKYLRWILNK